MGAYRWQICMQYADKPELLKEQSENRRDALLRTKTLSWFKRYYYIWHPQSNERHSEGWVARRGTLGTSMISKVGFVHILHTKYV